MLEVRAKWFVQQLSALLSWKWILLNHGFYNFLLFISVLEKVGGRGDLVERDLFILTLLVSVH